MIRMGIALICALAGLFGVDAWARWLMDASPDARALVLSPGFTAFAFIGGSFVAFLATAAVSALIFGSDALSGRGPEGGE